MAYRVEKIAEDLFAQIGVCDLGMELQPVNGSAAMLNRREFACTGRGNRNEIISGLTACI